MKRLALVGCAHIHTPGFIRAVGDREGVVWAGVWDHDAERAERNAEKTGSEAMGLSELLGQELDGVVVCSETRLHEELAREVVSVGRPVFIEKPVGFGARDSAVVAELVDAAGVVFQTGYFSRGMAEVRTIKRLVDSGALGTLTRARFSNVHSGALGGWFDGEWRWMADLSEAGVGAFGDLGTHHLDLMIWIFGEVESVTGAFGAGTSRYAGCEELGEALVRFKSGVLGTLAAGWADVGNPVRAQIFGTGGQALWADGLKVAGADGVFGEAELEDSAPAGFGAFLDVVEGGAAELVSVREAAYRDRVMEAIYLGAREGRWIGV